MHATNTLNPLAILFRTCSLLLACAGLCVLVLVGVRPVWGADPPRTPQKDWRTIEVTEAFPGSLAELENPRAQRGGVSGTATGNKGSFALNAKGGMAITFVQGLGDEGDVVIGRSLDGGKTWQRHKLQDIDMRNSWRVGGAGVLSFPLMGPGPEVEINDESDVVFACLSALNSLLSFGLLARRTRKNLTE